MSRNFNVALAMLILLCMAVFWLLTFFNLQNLLQRQADSLGPKLAQQAAALVTDQVLANDLISMNVLLDQMTRDSVIAEAAVLNIDGGVIAASRVSVPAPRSLWTLTPVYGQYSAPIALQDSVAGEVRLLLNFSYMEAGLINSLMFIVAATLLILVVALALSTTYFQYLVRFPLKLLAYSLARLRWGEIETIPESRTTNEVGKAIRQFNATARFLAQNTFIASLPEADEAAAEARVKSAGDSLEATVLCIRIANFQYLASTLDDQSLVALLNRFNFLAGKAGSIYSGQVCDCADGEVIIGFTATQLEDEQSFYGICTAHLLLMLAPVMEISDSNGNDVPVKLRAAVHSGPTVPGFYSPMTGTVDNVFGKTFDLARQICDDCPDFGVLVSERAFRQAGAETRVRGEQFSVVNDGEQINTYLCSEPMESIESLLSRQFERLTALSRQYFG